MLKSILVSAFMFAIILSFSQDIELKWEFYHPLKHHWIKIDKPQSIQETFIQIGELPDPFIGANEKKFDWIEDHLWEFKSFFHVSKDDFEKTHQYLEFGLVDTYAKIYLNDTLILETDNFFHPYRIDIKPFLKKGENKIKAIFTPPTLFYKERYENEKFHFPAPNDLAKIAIAPLARKPQYQFGWDWAPRINTIGFLKPVYFKSFDENKLLSKNVQTIAIYNDTAIVEFDFQFLFPIDSNNFHFKLLNNEYESSLIIDKEINYNNCSVKITTHIINPKLWWPRGFGDPNLYNLNWAFKNEFSNLNLEVNTTFGIRKSELVMQPDEWGTSYFFKVNDIPIFCKGGDYIPQDVFPSKVTDESIRKMIQQMVDANFNMVRVWGGGYYPDDVFYEECDKQGLMVWQDLMFACSMYPGDSVFLKSVENELAYQLPRILRHPSVMLINGNNEVEVAWGNWGFQSKYSIYGKDAKIVEQAYDDLFKVLASKKVYEIGLKTVPYIHTSPLSNWGKDEFYNSGSMHYWGVWHGKDPIEDFGRKAGRFNAEYGFQSFPEMSTIYKFAKPDDWSLDSEIMKHHQKSYVGNGMIKKHADELFGETDDFERFVYLSQLTQSKAVEIAIAGHRTTMPKCMGTLYWQVNDCWPGPTWSSIDYYGNWKALHYKARQSYQDVVVLEKTEKIGEENYVLVYNLPTKEKVTCNLTIMDNWGDKIKDTTFNFIMDNLDVQQILSHQEVAQIVNENWIVLNFNVQIGGKQYESNYTILGDERTIPSVSSFNYNFDIIEDGREGELTIESKELLKDFWITYLKAPIFIENNFVDLVPGVHKFKVKLDPAHKGEYGDFFQFYWR